MKRVNHNKRERIYDEKYFTSYIESSDKKRSDFEKRIQWFERYAPKGKLLDIGCETGIFLEMVKEKGWEGRGIEFSEFACKRARQRIGDVVVCGDLRDVRYGRNTFDVVTLWHTLEHLTDPLRTLKEIKRILKPGGLLVLNSSAVALDDAETRAKRVLRLPAADAAARIGNVKVTNSVMLGAFVRASGLVAEEDCLAALREHWSRRRAAVIDPNVAAFRKGVELAAEI